MRKLHALLAGATILSMAPAQAEVLEMTGEFAAPNREASMARSVAVDRFGGQDGPAFALALERALADTPFDVLAGRAGRRNAQASIDGVVTSVVDESPFKKKEKKCVEKAADGKCTKEEMLEVTCRRRAITLKVDVRMVDNEAGRILYSQAKPFRNEASWCPGSSRPAETESVIAGAIGDIAHSVRMDIAPHVETYRIRLLEGTRGLSKEASRRFKDLVKQSKRDPRGACAGWAAMDREIPNHDSIVFDLALCAEDQGDYPRALALYRRAQSLIGGSGGEATEGVARVNRLIAGREDARERARRG